MKCSCCDEELDLDYARWYCDEAFCEECFFDRHAICEECNQAILRSDTHYDDMNNPYCYDCYFDLEDPNAPKNPHIEDIQRTEIISLSKKWLCGEKSKTIIRIKENDLLLTDIRLNVGFIDKNIYVFGILDREDYQLLASPNIIDEVKEYCTEHNWDLNINITAGVNKLGISQNLRKNKFREIVEMIKSLATIKTS